MKRAVILHPFFFVLFPIIQLVSYNIKQIHVEDTYRAIIIGLCITGLLFLFLGGIVRSWIRGGFATSLVLVLFFSFGHVYLLLIQANVGGGLLARADILAAVYAAFLIVGVWFCLRIMRPSLQLTWILNIVSVGLVFFNLIGPIVYFIGLPRNDSQTNIEKQENEAPAEVKNLSIQDIHLSPGKSLPDVYYIILDGYGREDILSEIYAIDQDVFITSLRQKGFFVASKSYSNYSQTLVSLASSLNFDYLSNLITTSESENASALIEYTIHENKVLKLFKSLHYTTYAFSTGYGFSELKGADHYIEIGNWLNHFEEALLRNTAAVIWLDQAAPDAHRAYIRSVLTNLTEIPEKPGPKFIFAHVLLPHPPFVFDRNGSPVQPTGSGDGQFYFGTKASYISAYREQVLYTGKTMDGIIQTILEKSSAPPIIIIQGDHGPGAFVNFESFENTCVRERFSILNAYYFPGVQEDVLYDEVSPVNTFRILLNTYFAANLPLLEDRSFYSTWSHPLITIDPSHKFANKCPAPD